MKNVFGRKINKLLSFSLFCIFKLFWILFKAKSNYDFLLTLIVLILHKRRWWILIAACIKRLKRLDKSRETFIKNSINHRIPYYKVSVIFIFLRTEALYILLLFFYSL